MARSDVEVLSECCDDLGAFTACVGVVLDFEVGGVAHHPVADFFGEYWPERAVFVKCYFVACEDEDGGYEYRDRSLLHSDGSNAQCCVDVSDADAPVCRSEDPVEDDFPCSDE